MDKHGFMTIGVSIICGHAGEYVTRLGEFIRFQRYRLMRKRLCLSRVGKICGLAEGKKRRPVHKGIGDRTDQNYLWSGRGEKEEVCPQ